MGKRKYVDQLTEGERVDDIFLVKSSRLAETRAGKPYLILELTDKGGGIGGPVWDNAEHFAKLCSVGSFVQIRGQVQAYREKLQLRIEDITQVAKETVSLADFLPASPHDVGVMAEEVLKIIATVENKWVRRLLHRFFNKGEFWERFQQAPAAKGVHHAYAGGLLEHCLSMAKVAVLLADHYAGVDRSILLAGVFFHDIGKLEELQENIGLVDYTIPGRLKGHLVIGSEMVAAEAAKITDFPADLLVQIQHLILSHHGRLEFGSPTLPMTPEAFVLSFIDDLDSKMNLIEQLRRKHKGDGPQWTDYQRTLERYLLLKPFEKERKPEDGEEKNHIQKSLF